MNLWKTYIAYIRDNPKGYWFKRKWYGWGWTPVRWQGWAAVGLTVALITWNAVDFGASAETGEVTDALLAWFFVRTAGAIGFILAIAYWKGEPPKWMWGVPPQEEQKQDGGLK